MLTLKSKVNILFFFLHHFSVVSGCFDFSYPLPSVQFSLGRATLGCQINQWKASTAAIKTQMTKKMFK